MVALLGSVLALVFAVAGVILMRGGRENTRRLRRPSPPVAHSAEPTPETLPPKHVASVLRQVSDADIELEIRCGRVVNAIRLYREQTGADPQEAKSAVEAWRARLTAS